MSGSRVSSRRAFLKNSTIVGGGAALGACATSPLTSASYPSHNDRTKGWLRYIWQKATTADDWAYRENLEKPWGINIDRGEIDWNDDGIGPHPWWDQYTGAPMLSYPRFDLADSSYGVMLMADQTPAWREVYTRIMDELATRHTSYWAAIDWNTFIGPSPDRANYGLSNAPGFQAWPERVRGNYDSPGWTANGVEPWGLQPDPIGADGNLFFRGWLNLVLSIYKYVSGDDKWEQPWQIAGYENEHFEWTQPAIVEHLQQQYLDHPEGPHCENTKIWPFCNAAAGLGIYLSDQLGVTNAHGVFENWIEFMKDSYMGINGQNQIEWMTLYYDPLEQFKVNTPGVSAAGAGVAFYLLPQSTEIATQIYDAMANSNGWRDASRDVRPSALGMAIAKSLGDETVYEKLRLPLNNTPSRAGLAMTWRNSAGGLIMANRIHEGKAQPSRWSMRSPKEAGKTLFRLSIWINIRLQPWKESITRRSVSIEPGMIRQLARCISVLTPQTVTLNAGPQAGE